MIRVVARRAAEPRCHGRDVGPLTPLFGDDEALRLTQYATALAPALDRVLLVERMRRNAQLLDLAYDAVTTWNVRTQLITFWNKGAEELYGWSQPRGDRARCGRAAQV